MSLAPLGTRAMRQRMLAEGREARLVGELASATPTELLGVVAEHYRAATGPEEIAIWRAHGDASDSLVQAMRDYPFLSRRVMLVKILADSVPERDELLDPVLRDPELGLVVLLAGKQDSNPEEASPAEAAWLMAGSILQLLEIGGPATVREQLEELPPLSGRT